MQSERAYTRGYLSNDGFYRQKLSTLKESEAYDTEKEEDGYVKNAMILAGLTVAGGSAKSIYGGGGFRNYMQKFIIDFATSDGLASYADAINAVKTVTRNPDGTVFTDVVDISHNRVIQNAIKRGREERAAASVSLINNTDTIRYIRERNRTLAELQKYRLDKNTMATIENALDKQLITGTRVDIAAESKMMKEIGMRHATINDLIMANRFDDGTLELIERAKVRTPDILKSIADQNILITDRGQIVDARTAVHSVKDIVRSTIQDFSIPVLGINPLKMFQVDELLNATGKTKPMFHVFKPTSIQPSISMRSDELGSAYVYANGDIIDTVTGKVTRRNMELHDSRGTMAANKIRKMADMKSSIKVAKHDTPLGRAAFEVAKFFDFDMQDEMFTHKFDLFVPGTYLEGVISKGIDKISPVRHIMLRPTREAFGPEEKYVAVAKAKGPKSGIDMVTQLFEGRKSFDKVTNATLYGHMLVSRMSDALTPYKLGLSNKSLGSAKDAYIGLLGKRIMPVVVGIAAFKYLDYKLENKDGVSPKDRIIDGLAVGDIALADMKDRAGINSAIEKMKDLSPGIEFLAEIPIIGKLFDSKSAEETKEYWDKGYDPIRKGRWWTLGNTPYGGSNIEYFRPNAKRRIQSDYAYTDVKHGSKEEYWDNHWLPTLDSPLAPVKHFITDPYHYEKKQYDIRPYAITGGIPELQEIPLIGGVLNATVGQLLKPTKKMHLEYWDGERLREPSEVEQLPQSMTEKTRPQASLAGSPGMNNIPSKRADDFENMAYSTASGVTSIYAKPDDVPIWLINHQLKDVGVKRVNGVAQIRQGGVQYGPLKDKNLIPRKPGIVTGLEDMYYDATELAGFYGFSTTTVAGDGVLKGHRVQSSSDLRGYADEFWDQSLGGFGGEISEIFRRFAPNKRFAVKKNELNPIRNDMPTWMPGPEYFTDFLHGDPYSKIKEGEYRLPGQGYEAMYGIEDPTKFKIGSSSFGGDIPSLLKHYLQLDDIEIAGNEKLKKILDSGTETHEKVEEHWEQTGVSVASEVYVKDEHNNIEGWIDSIIKDKTSRSGYAVADIKTINTKGFEKAKRGIVKNEYKAQMNFYMHMTGQDKAYLHFMNRDNPNEDPVTVSLEYDPEYLKGQYDKLETARDILRTALNKKIIRRGDLYSHMDRFRILADVAPYSENYRFYDSLMSKMSLRDEERKEVEAIRNRVSQVKEKVRLTPYKFKGAEIEHKEVTIKKVLDNGTILTEEFDDNPLKLAGVNFSTNEDTEEGRRAMNLLRARLRPGRKVTVGVNADTLKRVNNDTYKTMDAIIDSKDKKSLNKYMIDNNYATEDEKDDSATGIHARYSKGEIAYGRMFESISHMDTFFNTKFMHARSALEEYKRTDLYGKDWREWSNPVGDFLVPAMQNVGSKDIVTATAMGAFIGSLFGASHNRYGKIVGAAIGGASMFGFSVFNTAKEAITGEAYIPGRRKKEREVNEYFDTLKYVKNMKLFGEYRNRAIEEEGVDPAAIIAKNKEDGEYRKSRTNYLESIKRDINNEKMTVKQFNEQMNQNVESLDEAKRVIGQELKNLSSHRKAEAITPLAAQAIMYYNESEKTAYGYDAGEPLQNILGALSRKERKYFMPFVEAPEHERAEIIKLAPSYMKRALQSAYGMAVDPKKDLQEYFEEHYLPGEDWAGWNPDVNLDDVKIKMVKHEGLDSSEFDIWEDDEVRAAHLDIPIPKINFSQQASVVRSKLTSILSEAGLSDVTVDVTVTQKPGIDMNVDIANDRRKDIEDYINNNPIF